MKRSVVLRPVVGREALPFLDQLAKLRLEIFRDYPYLYDGDLAYEKNYLSTYAHSPRALMVLAIDQDEVVGVSTGIPLIEEEAAFIIPLLGTGYEPQQIFYFGESVLKQSYRGQGVGKAFMQARETYALSLPGIEITCFCSVIRNNNDPRQPQNYRSIEPFWHQQGYERLKGVETEYTWKELGEESASAKRMQFWMKHHKLS